MAHDLFHRWAMGVVRRRLRSLDRVEVEGLAHLRDALSAGPVVGVVNHVCWWDALLVMELGSRVQADVRVLVDAQSLVRFPFFRRMGAVGIDLRSALAARRGLREAAAGLQNPGQLLWIFPQGRYRPPEARPFGAQAGAGWVAARSGAAVIPVALAYPFLQGPSPAAYVAVGPPIAGAPSAIEAAWESLLAASSLRADRDRFALIPAPTWAERWLGRWFP